MYSVVFYLKFMPSLWPNKFSVPCALSKNRNCLTFRVDNKSSFNKTKRQNRQCRLFSTYGDVTVVFVRNFLGWLLFFFLTLSFSMYCFIQPLYYLLSVVLLQLRPFVFWSVVVSTSSFSTFGQIIIILRVLLYMRYTIIK